MMLGIQRWEAMPNFGQVFGMPSVSWMLSGRQAMNQDRERSGGQRASCILGVVGRLERLSIGPAVMAMFR